jgi:hypothetical protein
MKKRFAETEDDVNNAEAWAGVVDDVLDCVPCDKRDEVMGDRRQERGGEAQEARGQRVLETLGLHTVQA